MSYEFSRKIPAERIRQVREALKLRQLDLATKFAVTTRTVMRWEQRGAAFTRYAFRRREQRNDLEMWEGLEADVTRARDPGGVSRDTAPGPRARTVSRDKRSSRKAPIGARSRDRAMSRDKRSSRA